MRFIYISSLIILMLVITGCSETNNEEDEVEGSSSNTYEALLFVNGKETQSIGKTAEDCQVEPGELLGKVETKYGLGIAPKKELTSNFLEEGTEIYSVDGKPNLTFVRL